MKRNVSAGKQTKIGGKTNTTTPDGDRIKELQAKQAMLRKHGWVGKDVSFLKNIMTFWYHKKYKGHGYNLEHAFMAQDRENREKAFKVALKDGTATIICNKCGHNMKLEQEHEEGGEKHFYGYYGLVDGEVWGGFDSTFLSDGTIYRFKLCEKCLAQLFKSFKIKVEKESYI